MKVDFTLSIAIVTMNRPESLQKTLHSILLQNTMPYEIVISDDSDKEDCIEENKTLAKYYNCKYIAGPHKGLYANRNFVANYTKGTHYRTMDDDHTFPQNHLVECMKAINKEPDTIWTIGEFELSSASKEPPCPVPGQLHARGFSYYDYQKTEYYGISCGATIYPRSVLNNKLFNCDLYPFGIMYLEYGARLKYFGYTLKPLYSTYVVHDVADTTASRLKKEVLQEARFFSMLCLSLKYQHNTKNVLYTISQMLQEVVSKEVSIKTLLKAYNNYKKFQKIHPRLVLK